MTSLACYFFFLLSLAWFHLFVSFHYRNLKRKSRCLPERASSEAVASALKMRRFSFVGEGVLALAGFVILSRPENGLLFIPLTLCMMSLLAIGEIAACRILCSEYSAGDNPPPNPHRTEQDKDSKDKDNK